MKLATALVLAVVLTLGVSQENDGEGAGSEEKLSRDVSWQISNNQVQVDSSSKNRQASSKFRLQWQVNDNRLGVQIESFVKGDDARSKARFKWKIWKVVEYNDTNATPGYQVGDRLGASWDFSRSIITFTDLPKTKNAANEDVYHFQGASADGFFKVVGHLSGGEYNTDTKTFTPTAHKFDIIINPAAAGANFNYQLDNGRVAILGWVMSKTQMIARNADDSETTTESYTAKRVRFGAAASPEGFFSWDLNPNCTNAGGSIAPCPVIGSPLSADDASESKEGDMGNANKKTSHSFDLVHPRLIEWDPLFGITSASGRLVPGLAVLLALVMSLFNYLVQ